MTTTAGVRAGGSPTTGSRPAGAGAGAGVGAGVGAGAGLGPDRPRSAFGDALEEVSRQVAAAADLAGWRLAGDDVLVGIGRVAALRGRVEALYLDLVRELDSRGMAVTSPVATTPEGFLRTACLVGAGQARRDVAAARATALGEPLAPFAAELAAGRRTRAHVDVAVRCLDRVPAATLARPGAPETVLDFLRLAADDASPLDMDRAARQLLSRLDPDDTWRRGGVDPDGHTRRFLDVSSDMTGMVVGAFQLDPVAGATLRAALDAASAPEPGADGEPDRRPARQRRADALDRIADTALGAGVPRRGGRPRVVVHVTPEQLTDLQGIGPGPGPGPGPEAWDGADGADGADGRDSGAGAVRSATAVGPATAVGMAWLEGGDPVPRSVVRRLTCDAVLQRLVVSPSLGPLDVGREHRLVTVSQRRALAARDGGCVIPGCGAPPDWCDAHHVVHWVDGGRSDLDNYASLCPAHHTAVHASTWHLDVVDGLVMVTPPHWVDGTRTPRPARHQHLGRVVDAMDVRTRQGAAGRGASEASVVDPSSEVDTRTSLHDPLGMRRGLAEGSRSGAEAGTDRRSPREPAPAPGAGDGLACLA